ncbi:MAG: 23S rRNA (pseudouridine(1915)-N(3))-methyltransferase RlmH [Coriobacteriia bacterium]
MMRITIVAVGRLKERWWRDAAEEYLKRLRPYVSIDVVEVADRDLGAGVDRAMREEGEAVGRALPAGARVVALAADGLALGSEGLAGWLDERMRDGRPLAFVLGGSAGIDPALLARADERLSLSPMTFPHQMARVVLLEQVYRAFRILRGEPYHR